MKKYLNIVNLIILSFIVVSCSNNAEQTNTNDFAGYYKINSISSSLQIDLNNDGLKSNDYLQEIKSNYISYDNEIINYGYDNELTHNFAEARPTKYQSNNAQFLDIQFPIQRIDSIYQGNDRFVKINMEYEKMYTGFIYKLTNDNIVIESDPFSHFEFYDINNFVINRLNNIEFEVIFDFKVYDFTENDWIETTLKARFEKVNE
ncbi:hypothetical protein EV196_102526 [Mariniflexile fucanivorans]|uniref:Lipocalin-like protein n=1 Tax=Mariniflexile fucanivorans TaxID=264023 RepID=A0A4R1RNR5_9FLAO|nr:hypothetical protein [Mariniflexile fucanivorans]TCL67963.1 hypothetical protein EV196_102526 [Mariniflexile fucanivorans]